MVTSGSPRDDSATPQAGGRLRYIVGLVLVLIVLLAALVWVLDPCFTKRSVRFDPADGLRLTDAITDTELARLPWSLDPVPQRYELVTPRYRIVLATDDAQADLGVTFESAKGATEDVLLDGPGIFETPGSLFARYFVRVSPGTGQVAFTVRDRQGVMLGRHVLTYSTPAYSYYCGY